MITPLISIGLPVVKSKFLKKSIECCLIQSYRNIEIIIQNNAKHQNTKSEIRELVALYSDPRIKYFETKEQLPMVQNWNATLEKANGEYFSILCDDDFWEPTFLEEMISLTNKYPLVNIFHSRVLIIDDLDNQIGLSPLCPEYESGLDFIYHRVLGFRRMFLSDFMVRTKSLSEIGGFFEIPDGWGSDDITWMKIAMTGGISYSSKELFYYRKSVINTSNNNNNSNKLKAIDIQNQEIRNLIENHTEDSALIVTLIKKKLFKYETNSKIPFLTQHLKTKYKFPVIVAKIIVYADAFFKLKNN
jgi:glycosyltransferase involved in cell wall biosynthesis